MNSDNWNLHCPPDRRWLDWAWDRLLDLDPESRQYRELAEEFWRENWRQVFRGEPRRLKRRNVIQRRDPQTLRTMIWLRNRKMLRARGVGLRSVPVSRQIASSSDVKSEASQVVTRKDSFGDDLRSWAGKVQAKDVFWLRTQCDLHAIADWLSPDAQAELKKPKPENSSLDDFVNDSWRAAIRALKEPQ